MFFAASEYSSLHSYLGSCDVNFFSNSQEELFVAIDTEQLHIRSVESTESECAAYAALFGDEQVMEKFATGQTKTREQIEDRIKSVWVKRWKESDPYSSFSVFKNDTDEFLGNISLEHSVQAGCSEIAYLFNHSFWGKGYGSEAVTAVVKHYAPATVSEGYALDGRPLEKIVANVRVDNAASIRILEKIGMQITSEQEEYGALRYHYSLDVSAL